MKKLLSFLMCICLLVGTIPAFDLAFAESEPAYKTKTLDASHIQVARRGDDESKFGGYHALEDSDPSVILKANLVRWIFYHDKSNGTYIQFDFDQKYTFKSVTIGSSTDEGAHPYRAVWHAAAMYYNQESQIRSVFDQKDINSGDAPKTIAFNDVTTDKILFNIYGSGIDDTNPNGGADMDDGKIYCMGIRYITFEVVTAEKPDMETGGDLIYGFEDESEFAGEYGTLVSYDKTAYSQGSGGLRQTFETAIGKDSKIGASAVCNLKTPIDISKYNSLSLDLYLPTLYHEKNGFEISFGRDGVYAYSYNTLIDFGYLGWRRLFFGQSSYPENVDSADLTKINCIRITWYNYDQIESSGVWFSVDNLVGYSDGYKPYTDYRGYYILNDFEDQKGLSTVAKTSVCKTYEGDYVAKGNASLKAFASMATGQAGNVGMTFLQSFAEAVDLSDYDSFSVKIYLPGSLSGMNRLFINFITDKGNQVQDGYNYGLDITDFNVGWNTVNFNKSMITKVVDSADWSKINGVRFAWFTDTQNPTQIFCFDDFYAYDSSKEYVSDYSWFNPVVNMTLGDSNDDGKVDTVDALRSLQKSIEFDVPMSARQEYKCDVDFSDDITSLDALRILQRSIDVIKCFAGEEAYYDQMDKLYGNNKPVLKCDQNGKFNILTVSDFHRDENDDGGLLETDKLQIRKMIEAADADLLVFNGDTISDGGVMFSCCFKESYPFVKNVFKDINEIVAQYGITWTLSFGNHDSHHGNTIKEFQLDAAMECSNFAGCYGYVEGGYVNRWGNNVLPVLNHEGTEVVYNVWTMDTGTFNDPVTNCNYVSDGILNWYKTTSAMYTKINGGNPVKGSMYVHIRSTELSFIVKNPGLYGYTGIMGEDYYQKELPQSNLCTAFLEMGDIKGLYFGHDHYNNFAGVYKGIEFGCDGCLDVGSYGYGGYYAGPEKYIDAYGGRVINVDENNPGSTRSRFIAVKDEIEYTDRKTSESTLSTTDFIDFDSKNATVTEGAFLRQPSVNTVTEGVGDNRSKGLLIQTSDKITEPYAEHSAINNNTNVYLITENDYTVPDKAGYLRFYVDLSNDLNFRAFYLTLFDKNGTEYSMAKNTDIYNFYVLRDGQTDWHVIRSGNDGCISGATRSDLSNFKGWVAIPLEKFKNDSGQSISTGTKVNKMRIYYDMLSCDMFGKAFVLDSFNMPDDYWAFK